MVKGKGIKLNFLFTAKNNVTSAFNQVGMQMQQINQKGDAMRENFEDLNTGLQKIATVGQAAFQAMSGFIKDTVDTGSKFEFVMSQVRGALEGLNLVTATTDAEMGELRKTIFRLSVEAGESSMKVAKAASLITQTGKSLAETEELLGHFIHLATVEGQDFERLAGILTDTMTSLNMEVKEAGKLVDVLATISLATGIQEIDTAARAIGKASGAMHQYGVEVQDVGIGLGLLSKAFVVSAGGIEAFTLVGNSMVDMVDQFGAAGLFADKNIAAMQEQLGESAEGAGKFETVFRLIRDRLGDNQQALDAFGVQVGLNEAGMEGLRKITNMANDEFEHMAFVMKQSGVALRNFEEIAGSAQRRIGALDTVVEQMKISFFTGMITSLMEPLGDFFGIIGGEDGQRANNIIMNMGRGFGKILAPGLKIAVDFLDKFLTIMEKLSPQQQEFLGTLLAMAGGFAFVLANIRLMVPVMKLLQGFFNAGNIQAVGAWGNAINFFGRMLGISSGSLAIFNGGIRMLGRVIAPIGVLISVFSVFGTVMKDGFGSMEDWVSILMDVGQAILLVASIIPSPIQPFAILASVILAVVNGFDLWQAAIKGVAEGLDSLGISGVLDWAKEAFPDWFNTDMSHESGKWAPKPGSDTANNLHITVHTDDDMVAKVDSSFKDASFATEQ